MGNNVILYNILPIQTGSGDPSPDNIRPILPGLSLLRDDGTTLNIYGGTLDAISGVLTDTHNAINIGGIDWSKDQLITSIFERGIPAKVETPTDLNGVVFCSSYKPDKNINLSNIRNTSIDTHLYKCYNYDGVGYPNIFIKDTRFTEASDFKAANVGQLLVLPRRTNITYQLTPNELKRALISLGVSLSSLAESRRRIVLNSQNNIIETGYAYYSNNLNLTFIDLPGGVKSISNNTFDGCSNLVKVIMPDGVTGIWPAAFRGCSKLKSINSEDDVINIPDGVKNLQIYAFKDCSSITSVHLPSGMTTIGNQVFYGCSNLESINLPNTITSIGSQAFRNCPKLTTIDLPDSITSIADNCFYNAGLTSVVIPSGVTSIGTYGFFSCKKLLSLDLPDTLTDLAKGAFQSCTQLSSIICRAVVPPSAQSNLFFQVPATANVYVPAESVEAYKTASYAWSSRADYIQAIPA